MAASSKKEETDLFDLLKELVRNWKIMIPCLILSGIAGVFIALWIRPVYQVDALIQIESKNNKSMGMTGGLSSLFATTSPAETEIELINSRQIIGEAVEKMRLQYEAIPTNKMDRLLHKEGRMELNNFDFPWKTLSEDEDIKPWIAVITDTLTYDLYDHHDKKILSGTIGQTYRVPYANDTLVFSVLNMKAIAGQKFKLYKLDRLMQLTSLKELSTSKKEAKKLEFLNLVTKTSILTALPKF